MGMACRKNCSWNGVIRSWLVSNPRSDQPPNSTATMENKTMAARRVVGLMLSPWSKSRGAG